MIEELQAKYSTLQRSAVTYFYFDFNTTAKQELASCLASIVVQLYIQTPDLAAHIKKSHARCSHGSQRPSLGELKELFSLVTQDLEETFIVLDALDECPKTGERELLLEALSDMLGESSGNVHLLLTSRREPDIEEVLLPLLTSPAVSLRGSELDLDIKLFISWQLATDSKLKKWSREIKAEVEAVLTAGANGM